MRRATIKRKKGLAAISQLVTLYIEDVEHGTEEIGGAKCRRLCTLKNGEERTFDLSTEAVRIFAVMDEPANDSQITEYLIDAGGGAINLEGKCELSADKKARFSFLAPEDNMSVTRLLGKKVWFAILVPLVIVLAIAVIPLTAELGFYFHTISMKPADFRAGEMTITLTDDFAEDTQVTDVYKAFASEDNAIFIVREGYDDYPILTNVSAKDYCELLKGSNGITADTLETEDGLYYFVYDHYSAQANLTFTYYTFAYKSEDAMWVVQFCAVKTKASRWEKYYFNWARSVRFD